MFLSSMFGVVSALSARLRYAVRPADVQLSVV